MKGLEKLCGVGEMWIDEKNAENTKDGYKEWRKYLRAVNSGKELFAGSGGGYSRLLDCFVTGQRWSRW